MVGDSVMGCLSSAGDGDASPGALSRIDKFAAALVFGNKPKLQLRAAPTDSGWQRCWYSVCQPRALRHPEQYAETDASGGLEAPLFRAISDLRINSPVKP